MCCLAYVFVMPPLTYENRMPLGDLMKDVGDVLNKTMTQWLESRDLPAPSPDELQVPPWKATPALRDQLKTAYLARFALAFAGQLEYHTRESLERARDFGATYTEMGEAIGMTRQGVQRRWGTTPEERDRALNTIAEAIANLQKLTQDPALRWNTTPIAHTYDPEATLSAAIVAAGDDIDQSPKQVLIFRDGKYVGPALDQNLTSLRLEISASRMRQVAIEVRDPVPDSPFSAVYTARFMLKNGKDGELRWFGDLPVGVTSPIATCGHHEKPGWSTNSADHHSP